MTTSARSAAVLLLAASAAGAWCLATAVPAVAEPGDDSANTSPAVGASTVLPFARTIDGIWNQYVPPNPVVPPSPVASFDAFVEQFAPTTTQARDFFGLIQQFRPPGIAPPAG